MLHIPGLYVAQSENRGRGVFTSIDIEVGDFIEICPLLIFPPDQVQLIDQTMLHDYYWLWAEPKGAACLPLGYGSLYNHSFNPNAEVFVDLEKREFEILCARFIEAGTEILLDYTNGGGRKSPILWFESVED